jgi:hypothetical protein
MLSNVYVKINTYKLPLVNLLRNLQAHQTEADSQITTKTLMTTAGSTDIAMHMTFSLASSLAGMNLIHTLISTLSTNRQRIEQSSELSISKTSTTIAIRQANRVCRDLELLHQGLVKLASIELQSPKLKQPKMA